MDTSIKDLLDQLFQLEWLLRRYEMQNHRDRGPMGSPHRGQGRILSLLKLKNEISQKELASILDIRPQSLGELLGKLEKAGYVTRTPSESDKRVVDVRLTEAGQTAADQPEESEGLDKLFDCLKAEEQENLSDYLGRLIEYLEKQLVDSDPRAARLREYLEEHGEDADPRGFFGGSGGFHGRRGFGGMDGFGPPHGRGGPGSGSGRGGPGFPPGRGE